MKEYHFTDEHSSTPAKDAQHDVYRCPIEECHLCSHSLNAAIEANGSAVVRTVHTAMPVCGCCTRAPCNCPNGPRWPCAVGCNHPDSWVAGHPERVKERSEAVAALVESQGVLGRPDDDNRAAESDAYDRGAADVRCGTEVTTATLEQAAYERGVEAMRAACWAVAEDALYLAASQVESMFKALGGEDSRAWSDTQRWCSTEVGPLILDVRTLHARLAARAQRAETLQANFAWSETQRGEALLGMQRAERERDVAKGAATACRSRLLEVRARVAELERLLQCRDDANSALLHSFRAVSADRAKALVRARNEGLERAAVVAGAYVRGADDGVPLDPLADAVEERIRAMMEPES